jgi:hypothetical protein
VSIALMKASVEMTNFKDIKIVERKDCPPNMAYLVNEKLYIEQIVRDYNRLKSQNAKLKYALQAMYDYAMDNMTSKHTAREACELAQQALKESESV